MLQLNPVRWRDIAYRALFGGASRDRYNSHPQNQAAHRIGGRASLGPRDLRCLGVTMTAYTAAAAQSPFLFAETNGFARQNGVRLHAHSEDVGWEPLYMSLLTVAPYEGAWPAFANPSLAFGLRGHGRVQGRLPGLRGSAKWHPGRLVLVPAGADCIWRREGGPVELCHIYLRQSLLDRLVLDSWDCDPAHVQLLPRIAETDPLIEQLVLALKRALEDGGCERLYLESVALTLGRQLLHAHSNLAATAPRRVRGLAPWQLRRVITRMQDCLEDGVALEELAELAGLSLSHFSHAFKAATGEAPHQYQRHLRVERAKAMLAGGDLPLATVALDCGFASQSHFTTTFRDHVGVSPGRWRAERLA